MKQIRFGVLGCASVARRLVIPAMIEVPTIKLVAVASRSSDKALQYANEFGCRAVTGYKELLLQTDLDAIYMPLPTGLHHDWAHQVLDAGKHLFIEKSLACNLTEAKSIVDKARSKGLLVKENYMFEYHAQQAVVCEHIRKRVGKIRVFRANFGFPPMSPDNFRYDRSLGGGALLDAGGYVLKVLGIFFPNHSMQVRAANLSFDLSDVDIAGAVMVDLERDGERISAHLAFGFDNHYQCGIEVWGSKAKLNTDRTFTAGPNYVPIVRIETADGVEKHELPTDNHFRNILTHFVRATLKNDHSDEYDAVIKQAKLQEDVCLISDFQTQSGS